jgi:AcrR family transcriptional regulator
MSPPRFRRLQADARREQILACAVRLFGERPYADVSTTDIASEAGVARGLLNHYFGTKRELYLEVVRQMVLLPGIDAAIVSTGSLRTRVEHSVDWFLDTVGEHGKTFVAVTGAGGLGNDRDVEQILAEADDIAARKVLEAVGVTARQRQRAVVRSYGALVKVAVREWVHAGTLTRADVHLLLSETLIVIVRNVLPGLPATTRRKP